jgi:protein SCO1/2
VRWRIALLIASVAAALAAFSALMLGSHKAGTRPMPEDYGPLPEFHLVDERGSPFTAASLRSHVTIADFIFTRCTSSCPRLTARMAELQRELERVGSDVRLVSFSVDPENDTPSVLTEYSARVHADPGRWRFVTGEVDEIMKTVVLGFKVSAAKVALGAGEYDVTHGNWFVLVDRAARLRGYYSSEPSDGIRDLVADALRLERRPL